MTIVKYGDAGDRIPVQFGEVWECGPHKIICADMQTKKYFEAVDTLGSWDCMWVDPPWNSGNAATFRTKAGVPDKVDIHELLDLVFKNFNKTTGSIYIEIGKQTFDYAYNFLKQRAGYEVQEWDIFYYRTKPCKYIRSGVSPIDYDFTGMDEMKVCLPSLEHEMKVNNIKTVFDCCTGQGLVPVTADKLGLNFIGTDLSNRRIAVSLDKLSKQSGYTPIKIGHIADIHTT